jgi:FkbM family methyltransferase
MTKLLLENQISNPNSIQNPWFIYGAGITAAKVFNYLQKKNIQVSGFIVDHKKIDTIFGCHVYSLKEFNVENSTVVLGYVPTHETVENIEAKICSILKLNRFIGYDFSFLSFGVFPENILESQEFTWINEKMADEKSRKILSGYIKARNSGNYEECSKFYDPDQYFPDDIIRFRVGEVFLDCGVYDGQTIRQFHLKTNAIYSRIIGFEPDKNNYQKSLQLISDLLSERVQIKNCGTWDKAEVLQFSSRSERVSEIDPDGADFISVNSIDNVLNGDVVTYIKMDVEGAELKSLMGARDSIVKYRPKLAVCIYHKTNDIFEIVKYIDSLQLNYRFFVRLHTRFSQELVLYCI